MSLTADVIVIGGGVIGSSITYYLSKRGKRVIQLERDYFNSGASGSCDTMISPNTKEPNEHLQLALYSVELYKTLSAELGRDIEYEQKGSLLLIENQEELNIMEGIIKKQNSLGLHSRLISAEETLRLQPGLNRDAIVGASYSEVDADVNPFCLNLAFADRAAALGAQTFTHEGVQEILLHNGAVAGVKTNRNTYYAPIVINAAGAWAPIVGKMVGLNIPIKPRRGQTVITEAVPPFVHKLINNARYIVGKHHPELLKNDHSPKARMGIAISLVQSRKGNVEFGNSREFVGYDTSNTYECLRELIKNATRIIPGLKDLNIIRTMGGVRPHSPDSKPLIGFVQGVPGFFLAAGHEGDGICLSPVTGKLVSDLIVDGKTDVPAAAGFDPNRFDLF
ncbi:NAD(P)/FAD-dependent oxidoreductase [Flavonifractor sp. HCP28S3_F3]|uniref:NAD(P)/FAD-dependent oxidoreductase n=1 Tax=Flavonifractor sp. HCP28S3_F3 TaxID=3438939 RepID=UPI003F89EAFE